MTKAEFIEKIENGRDIMFDIANRHFTILTWPADGILIDEQYPNDGNEKYFKTAKDLVEGFKVDYVPLADLCDRIIITDYS